MLDQPTSEGYAVEPPIAPIQAVPPPVWTRTDLSSQDVLCVSCGYNLRGARPDGDCPECGTPVGRSIQGNQLVFSSADYLAKMHHGLIVILLAMLAHVGVGLAFTALILVMVFTGAGMSQSQLQLLSSMIGFPFVAAQLWGWWMFSAPDPAVRAGDSGDRPRQIIRATLVVALFLNLLSIVLVIASSAIPAWMALTLATGLLASLAWLAQFIASLLYVRWLAPRIPDASIDGRAKLYLWLLPLIYVVGSCLIVGPLVASVLYLLLLNDIRLRLRDIRGRQAVELAQLGLATAALGPPSRPGPGLDDDRFRP